MFVSIPDLPPSPVSGAPRAYESLLAAAPVSAFLRTDPVLVALTMWQAVSMAMVFAIVVIPTVLLGASIVTSVPAGLGFVVAFGAAGWCAWWPDCLGRGAVAAAVSARADGMPISTGRAIAVSWARRRQLTAWLLTASLVGPMNGTHDRYGILGSWARFTHGLGWGLATSLTVPVIVTEGRSANDAIDRSVALLHDELGISARTRIRPFTYWAYAAVFLALVSLGACAVFVHIAHRATAQPGVAAASAALALTCGLLSFGALAIQSSANTILNTLTYRKAQGLSTGGIDPRTLPGVPAPRHG
jgi:hypothetical protein